MSPERTERPEEGWGFPPGSRKCHYFVEGGTRSLCGRWGFAFKLPLEPDEGASKEDCTPCRRELEKRKAAGPRDGADAS